MKARKLLYILLLSLSSLAYSQVVGIGTDSPDGSTALDIKSTTGGLLIPRMLTSERDAIASPAKGLMVFNTQTNCIEVYTGAEWFNLCWGGSTQKNKSSNGSAVIEGYNCNGGSTGTISEGTAVSGVTQTLKVTVSTAGSYDIKAVINGITFAGKAETIAKGNQDIVLTASGSAGVAGTSTFYINTVPSCRFERTIN